MADPRPIGLDLTVDEVLSTTRTVRRRLDLDRSVPDSVIDECMQLALQAPTGGNGQRWRFIVVKDPDLREGIAAYYRQAFDSAYVGRPGDVRGVAPSADPSELVRQQRIFDSVEYLARNMAKVPVLVIPCLPGRPSDWTSTREQAGRWGSLLPAVWSFMLAARSRGLGTAWTTMHLTYEREVAALLGIPYDQVAQAALIPLAYTIGEDFRAAARVPLSDVVFRDRWPTDAPAPQHPADLAR